MQSNTCSFERAHSAESKNTINKIGTIKTSTLQQHDVTKREVLIEVGFTGKYCVTLQVCFVQYPLDFLIRKRPPQK